MRELCPLDVIRSMAGRDKNRLMVIISVKDEEYVYVADGKLRTLARPKLKKKKHIRYEGIKLTDITSDKTIKTQINAIIDRRNEKLGKK